MESEVEDFEQDKSTVPVADSSATLRFVSLKTSYYEFVLIQFI